MPGHEYSQIASRLMKAGLSGETPCAIVSRASTAQQQSLVTTVAQLSVSQTLPAPTILIVGEVVRSAYEATDGAWEPARTLRHNLDLPGLLASAEVFAQNEEPRP
jgi:uroporphyrin-III C-methyltransferase